ncbi:electron transfer flavoprotein subunit alpha/FixB family protein [Paenibacillus crassostreae]|uniref:Electron transfer flavoprotein subunit alpha n=1 Tax=Paenibacillus crassostreae TaxID=1763538 RepID=A0A167CJ29_9BACL|nr:electron transfer flavoprotein subunit alpha/FixB family protein [Paenibacillus crassostreae]AOZ91825.1 electron transfer flavoprotein subunit alpha [Paenibacillus crassostreae]OAB73252.1 electron transfer flavoprotein subunit alpha [Paenibacillus crassostreae]
MSKSYVVIAEVRDGKLRQVTLEALQSIGLAKEHEDTVAAVVLGHQISNIAEQLSQYVSGQIHVVDHKDLEFYNAEIHFSVIKEVLDTLSPHAVFLGHTASGRDLAPMIAAYLNAGQLSDVISIEKTESEVRYTRPLYAGKAFEQKIFTEGPQVITIRPNNIAVANISDAQAEIITVEYSPPLSLRTIVRDVIRKTSGKVDLTEAKIVVSGGRGVKSMDGFKPLQELADVLNGAVGASRAACDAGYCDYAMQIGQTGKVVTPEIYIACGISGAIQHLAGMSQSRIIIAINKDPEAPIFKLADYGIVGDLFVVVPLLTEEFKKALA